MPTLAQAFNQLKDNLTIPKGLRQQVTERQTRIRTSLVKDPLINEIILGGSWARGTAITPLHDVDTLVVLRAPQKTCGETQSWLQGHVRQLYKDTEVRIQGRSIGIRFPDFSFDLVPTIAQEGGVYLIPTRDESWIQTNPRKAKDFAAERDRRCGQMAIPLVKMFKCWKRNQGLDIRSFHLEVLILRSLSEKPPSYAEGLWRSLRALPGELDKACPDPARLSPLDGYLSQEQLTAIKDAALRDADLIRRAIDLEGAGSSTQAITLCRQVIGTPFPG